MRGWMFAWFQFDRKQWWSTSQSKCRVPRQTTGRILWNAVTSPETVLNGNSVKTKLYNTPSPILHRISQLGENIEGQGYWVSQNTLSVPIGRTVKRQYQSYLENTRRQPDAVLMLGCPTLKQHWVNVSCLLGKDEAVSSLISFYVYYPWGHGAIVTSAL